MHTPNTTLNLKPEAIRFLASLSRGEAHLNTATSKHLAMADALKTDGLAQLVHYYRRPSGNYSVYRITEAGKHVAQAYATIAKLETRKRQKALQADAALSAAIG